MVFPFFPGLEGREGDHASWAVDDGLEGPADRGVVFCPDCFRGLFDVYGWEGTEGGEEFVFCSIEEGELGEEFLELGFVEGEVGVVAGTCGRCS